MSRFFLAVVLVLTSASYGAAATPQWIVVTAPAFREALAPLIAHRKAEGMRVVVLSTADVLSEDEIRKGDATKLRDRVRKLCRDHDGTSFVLLVGAIEGAVVKDPAARIVPTSGGTISRMKGQPSDNAYGCPDGGRLPTVAVGRFPARSAAEVKAMVERTLHYETDSHPGLWRRQMTVLAGIPAYNPLVDRAVETLAMARFNRLDPSWTGLAIYSNPQSRFCLPDDRLRPQARKYIEGGQAFILYLGHSSAEGLYAGSAPYLDRDDWAKMRISDDRGVFFTFGCNGCQLAGRNGEGYGVAALRNLHGPAAVIGSHGICFAAMVQLGADSLFETCFTGKLPERLGDAWLAIERGIGKGKIDAFTYRMLDAVDGDSSIPQETQRQEHLEMFHLLGDPALRLPQIAGDIEVRPPDEVAAGMGCTITGRLPARLAKARVRVTLERTVGSVPTDLEPVPAEGLRRDRVLLANHERANRFILASGDCTAVDRRFEVKLEAPAKLPASKLYVRVYGATDDAEAMTVVAVKVRPAATKP
jgi:hypothetical protein